MSKFIEKYSDIFSVLRNIDLSEEEFFTKEGKKFFRKQKSLDIGVLLKEVQKFLIVQEPTRIKGEIRLMHH